MIVRSLFSCYANSAKNIGLWLCFLLAAYSGVAQPVADLHKSLQKIHQQSNFPGFAIALVKDDSTLFANSYGYADKASKKPYTLQTIQPIGSVSKTFIALALMKCVELGYFILETNINDVLPFPVENPSFPNSSITVRQLATHTSSLLDNDSIYYGKGYQLTRKPTIALGDFLQDYFAKTGQYYSPKNFSDQQPGTSYAYSNCASALMAYLIEVKTKMSFAEFTAKYIFQPLKMTSTDWFYNPSLQGEYATLYQVNESENALEEMLVNADKSLKEYSCVTYPDGSLKTSVTDLTTYLKAMTKGYFTADSLLMGNALYKTMFAKQFTEATMPANMDPKEPNRGIFWSYSKKGSIRHTGSDPGVFSFISFNPTTKIGVVMTLNTSLDGGENHKTVSYFMKVVAALDSFEQAVDLK
jgi:CubicO group peptidase (beta-lactamase class C family)